MSSGVPLVTTRVGQAADLVRHAVNGWIVDVDDVDGLVHWTEHALRAGPSIASVLDAARETTEANRYERQDPLWRAFHAGFVDR
jgi:glycosyltransferase involved in cell wall biosynthesis